MGAGAELVCRSCGAHGLCSVIDLGHQPLANSLRSHGGVDDAEPRYPLELFLCTRCALAQVPVSVPPEQIFLEYPYFSSVSPSMVESARQLAHRMIELHGLGAGALVVEVASNDGYLLQHYRGRGIRVLGVEPARNVARVAEDNGVPTICEFFSYEVAERLRSENGPAVVLHANNVLAHVPDLNGFVAGLAHVLAPHGRLVVETPWLKQLLDRCEFDTIYHEHLGYYSVTTLIELFERHGLEVVDLELVPLHGGSLRVEVAHERTTPISTTVADFLGQEADWVRDLTVYRALGDRVRALGARLVTLLTDLRGEGHSLAAYGAAAKGSTLLNTFAIGESLLDYVVDRSPHKQGLFMPGVGLAIHPPGRLLEDQPEYLLLLAWNFLDEVLAQQEEYRRGGGRFIVPVPEPRIV
jgi:SAM-dependent methyltransferase